jgi:putative peptide zinc metalloprotease protein
MRRIAALLAALLMTAVLAPVHAGAEATGNDNTAIAVNTKDGSSLFKFSFRISRVMGDTVDSGNAAVAYASCTDCQTTAVAIQFVLLMSDTTTATPENLALAINENCTLCDTLASAYQFILSGDGPVHLTPEGMQQLEEIRRQLMALKDSGLSGAELQERIDALATEAYEVLSTSLVEAGPPPTAEPGAEPEASTSTSTTDTTEQSTTTTDEPTTSTTEEPSTSTTETSAP